MTSVNDGKFIIKISIIILIVCAIAGYAFFEARNLIFGPKISILEPANGQTFPTSLATVKGNAKNIAFLSLNDRQIFVDKEGNFNEELLLAKGYNVWTLEAKDKFGRVVSKKLELVFRNNL